MSYLEYKKGCFIRSEDLGDFRNAIIEGGRIEEENKKLVLFFESLNIKASDEEFINAPKKLFLELKKNYLPKYKNIVLKKYPNVIEQKITTQALELKFKCIVESIIEYRQDALQLGMAILLFRESLNELNERKIARLMKSFLSSTLPDISVEIARLEKYFKTELSPDDFETSYSFAGSRNLIYKMKSLQFEFRTALCLRVPLQFFKRKQLKGELEIKKEKLDSLLKSAQTYSSKDVVEFQKTLHCLKAIEWRKATEAMAPTYSFREQKKINNRLYAKTKGNLVTKVPRHYYTCESYFQIIEFLNDFITLDEFQIENYPLNSALENKISIMISSTVEFWKSILFGHNDNHRRNILISRDSNETSVQLGTIDFDTSRFYQDTESRDIDQKRFGPDYVV
ncbi:MAG: hypothetical protein KBF93_14425 [Leptospiraceae bacterium]|nr:hypothetical protein [Leptospiraceae bacterium]